MAIHRIVTVQVLVRGPRAAYKATLKKIDALVQTGTDILEEWKCTSPFGTAIIRFRADTQDDRIEVEGTFKSIEHALEQLGLGDAPRFVQSVTASSDSDHDFIHSCPRC